jgi:carbon monoxide dehydrogenase subunit G
MLARERWDAFLHGAHSGTAQAARGSRSNRVSASIDIPTAPERVWDTIMDPGQLKRWVTIHRRLVHADELPPHVGFEMDQQIQLRGVHLQVHWTLSECRAPERAVWEGRGPARSRAHTEYVLTAIECGTRFDYCNEFHAPLGPLGAVVSRALVGGMPQREANRSLQRLCAYLEQSSP